MKRNGKAGKTLININAEFMEKILNVDKEATAVHEAAHAVIAFLFGVPVVKIEFKDDISEGYKTLGHAKPIIPPKYNILEMTLEQYNDPEKHDKIVRMTTGTLFLLFAGDCAEKKFLNKHPEFPPNFEKPSDGYYAYLIIQQLCKFYNVKFDKQKFLNISLKFIEVLRTQFQQDKKLYGIIRKLAKKLLRSKKGTLGIRKIHCTIFPPLAWYYHINNYKPYNQINTIDLVNAIKYDD
ncbi:hypothetical protein ACFLS7_06400 [Bacteroidota bacterium]